MDPDGISIRSVEGMAAADYFVGELLGVCEVNDELLL